MAVTSTTRSASYTGNGAQAFPTGFKFLQSSDLTVTVDGVEKTEGVDYTVTGAGDDAGGTVTFTAAPAQGVAILITRSTAREQPVNFQEQGSFAPKTHGDAFDREMMALQDVEAELGARVSAVESVPEDVSALSTRTADLETRASAVEAKNAAQDQDIASLAGGLVPSNILLRWPLARAANWKARTSGVTDDLRAVAVHASGDAVTIVAVGGAAYGEPVLLRSVDGVHWTKATNPGTTGTGAYVVAFGAGQFLVMGGDLAAEYAPCWAWTSPDGVTWTVRTPTFSGQAFTPRPTALLWDGAQWVMVGQDAPNGTTSEIFTSTDGVTWTARASLSQVGRGIAMGDGVYVVVGDGGLLYTSTDAVTWTNRTGGAATFQGSMVAVVWGGQFVTAGPDAEIAVSSDGVTWTDRAGVGLSGTPNLRALVYDPDGIYVAAGDSGFVGTTSDPSTWTTQPAEATANLLGLVLVPKGYLVAVGAGGAILQSLCVPPAP